MRGVDSPALEPRDGESAATINVHRRKRREDGLGPVRETGTRHTHRIADTADVGARDLVGTIREGD